MLNWIFAGCSGLLGFLLRMMWEGLTDLRKADSALVERVNAIELLVAGQYVRKDDFVRFSDALFAKLDKLDAKIDQRTLRRADGEGVQA